MSRRVRLVASIIGLLLFVLIVWRAGPARLVAGLGAAWWVFALLVPLWVLVYACNAAAWRLLTSDGSARVPFPRALAITVSTFALNYATPMASFGGEPLKVLAATPWLGSRRAVGSVVAFRLLHSLSHVLACLLALVPAALLLPRMPALDAGLAVAGVGLVVTALFLLSRHREGLFVQVLGLLGRVPLLGRVVRRLRPEAGVLRELDAHLTSIYSSAPGRFRAALVTELAGRLLTVSEFTLIMWALGLGFHPLAGFVAGALSSLLTNLVAFIPFELGTKEGSLYLIFGWLGFDPSVGVQAALVSRLRELCWMALGIGLLWLAGDRATTRLGVRSTS